MPGIKIYFVTIGCLCLACALWLLVRRLRVLIYGSVALGRVVAHEARESDDEMSYLPVVLFTDGTGREHRFTSVTGSSARSPSVGKQVRVRYLSSNPRLAFVGSFLHMWAAPLALGVLGAAGIAVLWSQ